MARTDLAKKILIVDDEAGFAELFRSLLEMDGYVSKVAHDGIEALEVLKEFVPDAIVCDIVMPKMNGLEFFKEVRSSKQGESIPFLFLSGYRDDEMLSMARKLGVFTVLKKPVDFDHILSRLRTLLKNT